MTRDDLIAKIEAERPDLLDEAEEEGDDKGLLLADGFEDAFVGIVERFGGLCVACYDYRKCLDILMTRDEMTEESAEEYMSFNVVGAWVGEKTPAFLFRFTETPK